MKVLVTGSAGFIGFHLVKRLLDEGFEVVGIDNINDYYDVNLKYARLAETGIYSEDEIEHTGGVNRTYKDIPFNKPIISITNSFYKFIRLNLEDKTEINKLFASEEFDYIVNLAAQAGVRYSIENPNAYIKSNIIGFLNILEACRFFPVKHLVFASSSSVYGANAKIPFSEDDKTDEPVSLYAATKKSNELMAYTYNHLFGIPITGLRFFTVYGPWGRPDMSPILFANAIISGTSIKLFNSGEMERDYTFIDDIVEGIYETIRKVSDDRPAYRVLNIGNGIPVSLKSFVGTLEKTFGKTTEKIFMPMQAGDVKRTWADTHKLEMIIKYKPQFDIQKGIKEFVKWYNSYFNVS